MRLYEVENEVVWQYDWCGVTMCDYVHAVVSYSGCFIIPLFHAALTTYIRIHTHTHPCNKHTHPRHTQNIPLV